MKDESRRGHADLGTSQHYLSRDDEQHNFRFDHAINKAGEQLKQSMNDRIIENRNSDVPQAHSC
jgi:hypothetical protein